MKTKLLLLLALPAVFTLLTAARFYVHNRDNGTVVSSGIRRRYLLHVPRSYDSARPTPLVISMHGAGGWPVQQMELSRWNRVADREGFIVVYPAGAAGAGPRVWGVGTGPKAARDVRFIADLIDAIARDYNVDRDRVYANGFSNGGGMSFALSCTLFDRIAAVGLVGSAQTALWSLCSGAPPVPVIVFHGTADSAAPYNGGRSWVISGFFPSIPLWSEKWAKRNGCAPRPLERRVAADVTRREYERCSGDASVVLYTIEGGGHTWPGGDALLEWFVGRTTRSIDASDVMWEFFKAHPQRNRHRA